jgi:hypothetical protein
MVEEPSDLFHRAATSDMRIHDFGFARRAWPSPDARLAGRFLIISTSVSSASVLPCREA